jgi:phosphopantothenoylcysteine decarboxylase / phosphopantothenate---cysteine ligase
MGIALAEAAASFGASVDLVLGPVSIMPAEPAINVIRVTTAETMKDECLSRFPECDVAILAAAVADFTPVSAGTAKMKRGDGELVLRLKPTADIAGSMGKIKKSSQVLAGFALETDDGIVNATAKLKRKKLDFIVLNSLGDEGAGFGYDTNRITIIDKNNNIDKFELKSKEEAARDILEKVVSILRHRAE